MESRMRTEGAFGQVGIPEKSVLANRFKRRRRRLTRHTLGMKAAAFSPAGSRGGDRALTCLRSIRRSASTVQRLSELRDEVLYGYWLNPFKDGETYDGCVVSRSASDTRFLETNTVLFKAMNVLSFSSWGASEPIEPHCTL
ncbi:unnamed protein product [Peniophora sp. CBMAI 1063]|nr:unnamed protein product [Peniophora sp. CBMAI 1063]